MSGTRHSLLENFYIFNDQMRTNAVICVLQNEHSYEMSSKWKTPWITYNGVDVAYSQFCIEYLNNKFSVDLNKDLSAVDRSVARAFQKMVEEELYW